MQLEIRTICGALLAFNKATKKHYTAHKGESIPDFIKRLDLNLGKKRTIIFNIE